MNEITKKHAGDPEAIQQAVRELYRDNDVNPFRRCVWPLLGPVAP